jgi:hypothetical protein
MGFASDMKMSLIGFALFALSVTTADALDMRELAPCRPAAARLCDRSGGMTWSNLLRCSATLAANASRVGSGCRQVLIRYGQL